MWTGVRGGRPRSTVDRAPVRGVRRRRRHGRPRRARSGGAAGHGGTSEEHGRARLDETSTMQVSPSQNVDGKEKLDDGDADFDGGAAEIDESGWGSRGVAGGRGMP